MKGRIPKSASSNWMGGGMWRAQNTWRSLFVIVVCLIVATTTLMLDQLFEAARTHSVQLVKGLPMVSTSFLPKRIVEDTPNEVPHSSGLLFVRDIVAFPEEVLLLVGTVSGSSPIRNPPSKDNLVCLFGKQHRTGIFTIEWKDDRRSILAVRCEHPPVDVLESQSKVATLLFKDSNFILPSSVQYTTNSSWKPLVYESVVDADSVILFVKGLVDGRGKPDNYSRSLDKLHCRFGSEVTSRVKVIAQEVVRCALPEMKAMAQLKGARISLFVPNLGLLPSVTNFDPPPEANTRLTIALGKEDENMEKKFHICSCTMLWNQAPFLREWIMYHGFLGIERWYLYDNNSDDEIEEVLAGLQMKYNVSRHAWPWLKTQEAGFSHCALRARDDCTWVLFADVDEYIFPAKDLYELVFGRSPVYPKGRKNSNVSLDFNQVDTVSPSAWREAYEKSVLMAAGGGRNDGKKSSVLRRLIDRTLQKGLSAGKTLGEVRLVCHNFGPSGRSRAPEEGVMVGYTCRMEWPQRHKSFVLLDAMSDSLLNVVHHFALREGYEQMAVHARIAVINHYKFQAWEVFKAKFVRRVATYVVDWREQTSLSNDRAPGLGLEAVEPADWPSRYCEEDDWALRNFTWNMFRNRETNLMPWQLQLSESSKGKTMQLE